MLGPLLAPMAFFAATSLVCLDDGYTRGEGGTAELMSSPHPSIRMESEVVRIDRLPKGRVRAKFVFKNHGKATDVLIGFPGRSVGDGARNGTLDNFKSWVDGKPVLVNVVPGKHNEVGSYRQWYTKRVHFNAGQRHVIEDIYTGGGGSMVGGLRHYSYVLRTGASWYGTIGKATIIVDTSGLSNFPPVDLEPDGAVVMGNTATWTLINTKPEDDIAIRWFPAFRNIYLNRGPLAQESGKHGLKKTEPVFLGESTEPESDLLHCQLVGHSVRLPARLAASWLDGHLKTFRGNRYRLILGERWAEFTIGSRTVIGSNGSKTQMEFPARIAPPRKCSDEEPSPEVGFVSLIKALGGKATLDMTKRRLDVWIK